MVYTRLKASLANTRPTETLQDLDLSGLGDVKTNPIQLNFVPSQWAALTLILFLSSHCCFCRSVETQLCLSAEKGSEAYTCAILHSAMVRNLSSWRWKEELF